MPTARPDSYTVASGGNLYAGIGAPGPPPAPAQSIVLTALDGLSAVAGGSSLGFSAQVTNPAALPLDFLVETASGPAATPTPSTSTWTLGDLNKAISLAWAAAGSSVVRVRDANNQLSNSLTVTVAASPPPPPPSATQLTLSVSPPSGTTGSTTATVTVTPNGPIATTGTASLGLTGGGTLGSATLNFTAGSSAAQSTTISRASDGTSTLTLTNSMGLANVGTPATFSTTGAAPPPPPSGGTATSAAPLLQFKTSWVGSQPWTLGHSFAKGEIPAGATVGNAAGTVQVDVRNLYDDGSLRFAVLSGITTSADIPLLRGASPAGGTNVAEPTIAAVVAFTSVVDAASASVGGGSFSADIATARANGITAWNRTTARKVREILGPVMSEFHYFVPTADAHTHVWFYVRAYSDGSTEVETWVENGWLQVAAPGMRTYNVTVTVGGTLRYTGTGIAHYHHARWSRVDWVGADPGAIMAQNVAHLQSTSLVPTLAAIGTLASTAYTAVPDVSGGRTISAYTSNAVSDQPEPFSQHGLAGGVGGDSMGAGGDTEAYGIVPAWGAVYLAEGDVRALRCCVGNGRELGRWALHYRDEATGRPYRATTASLAVNDSNSGLSETSSGSHTQLPAPVGATRTWYQTHSPASYFMAYLLTGRWGFMEGHLFQNGVSALARNATYAGIKSMAWWAPTRDQAATFRNMVQAELIAPVQLMGSAGNVPAADAAMRTDAVARLENVINQQYDYLISGSATGTPTQARGNAFGLPYQESDDDLFGASSDDGEFTYSGFMTGLFCTSFFYAYDVAAGVSNYASKLAPLATFHAKFPVSVFGAAASGSNWNWRVSSFVRLGFATPGGITNGGSPSDATQTYRASMDAMWTAIQTLPAYQWEPGTNFSPADNFLRKLEKAGANSYLRLRTLNEVTDDTDTRCIWWAVAYAHKIADRLSIPGIDTAMSRLIGSSTWSNTLAGRSKTRADYAITSDRLLPSWAPAEGACVELQGAGYLTNTFISQAPSPSVGPDAEAFRYVIDAYSGGGVNPHYITASSPFGAMFFHGGGHGNSNDNSTTVLKMGQSSLTFERLDNPTFPLTLGTDEANWAEHQDGRPYSAHTADCMVVVPPIAGGGTLGSLVRVMTQASGSAVWRNPLGGAGDTVDSRRAHAFDFATETWSRFGSASGLPSGSIGPYAVTAYDPVLQRIWFVQSVNETNCPTLSWINVLDGSRGSQACTAPTFQVDTTTMRYVATGGRRLLVMCGKSASSDIIRMNYIDLDAIGSSWLSATLSSSIACTYHNSFDWVPRKSSFYVFTGATATGVYQVEPPPTLTDPWTVTARTFTNGTTMTSPASSPAKRWSYVEAADCFVYVPRAGDLATCAVYAYRPH